MHLFERKNTKIMLSLEAWRIAWNISWGWFISSPVWRFTPSTQSEAPIIVFILLGLIHLVGFIYLSLLHWDIQTQGGLLSFYNFQNAFGGTRSTNTKHTLSIQSRNYTKGWQYWVWIKRFEQKSWLLASTVFLFSILTIRKRQQSWMVLSICLSVIVFA